MAEIYSRSNNLYLVTGFEGNAALETTAVPTNEVRSEDFCLTVLPNASAPTTRQEAGLLPYLQELCRYWAEEYTWQARQARLNAVPQFRTELDGVPIHLLHVRSPEPGALPLVLSHGWPGAVWEFLEVLGPLTDPAAHGGDPRDAFSVVVPSLPGYGWSGKPGTSGWGPARTADAWADLMTRLGYQHFGAQGGDWGSVVTTQLGARHPDRLMAASPRRPTKLVSSAGKFPPRAAPVP